MKSWWVAAAMGIAGDELESLGQALQRRSARMIRRLIGEDDWNGCWACYYGAEDPQRWQDRHTCGGRRATDRTGLSRVVRPRTR